MKKFLLLLFVAVMVSGCATNAVNQYKADAGRYIAENRPKALSGSMAWSSYYEGILALAERLPMSVNDRQQQINTMLEALGVAKEYEAGRMSKDDFYKWRESSNVASQAKSAEFQKTRAQCEYEAKAGAAGVRDTGRSGLNFDQMYKEKELFELCMKAKSL